MRVVEWPGTGSAPSDGTPSLDSLIEFARNSVDEDTVLVGHSMNATLLLAVAAKVPCRGVIGVAPADRLPPDLDVIRDYWDHKAEPERKARAGAIREEFESADDAAKPMLYVRYNNLRYYYDLDHPLPTPEEWTVAAEWSQHVMESCESVDWEETLDTVDAPVFLALGEYDFLAPPTQWRAPRDNWTVEIFTRSGHSPFVEQPDEFVAAVDSWLATL